MVRTAFAILKVASLCLAVSACSPRDLDEEAGPGARNAHGLAYDGRVVVLFGGATERDVRSDTWSWDGRAWRRHHTAGPSPRTFPAVASAPGRNRIFLFGGSTVLFGGAANPPAMLNDLWQWDGARWTRTGGVGPTPRAEASAAYDSRRERLVLFGGYVMAPDGPQALGDTWEFDGAQWEQVVSTGPASRHGASMTFDERLGRVLLFGGSDRRADTWTWDGHSWTAVATDATPPRYNAATAWDARARMVLRFGGWDGEHRTGDTSMWSGAEWAELTGPGPSPRNHSGLAYDEGRGCAVLFGGHDGDFVFGDLWERCNGAWQRVRQAPPARRVLNGH